MHETDVGEYYLQRDGRVRAALPLANLIFAASERTLSIFRPFAACPTRKLVSGCPDVRAEIKPEPRSDDCFHFLLLGTIERRKGQDILVDAIRQLNPTLAKRAIFDVVGSGLDAKYIAGFQEAAQSLPNLRVRAGVEHDQSLRVLAATDVLVCAARDESMPLTMLEAMCFGKTIISTAVGGIPEYMTEGVDALLVAPEDPVALAAAFEKVLRDPDAARKLGHNARAKFERCHTAERFGKDFSKLITELVASPVAQAVAS